MKRNLPVFWTLVLCLFFFKCGGGDPPPTPPGKVVFVLFDLSSSTQAAEVRQKYAEGFHRVLDKVVGGDAILTDAITDNPLAQSSFPVNEEFESFNPGTDNDLIIRKKKEEYEKKLQDKRAAVMTKAEALLANSRRINSTKILDAMMLAERVFKTYNRPRQVLVIFSDMIEESERYNFQKRPPTAPLIEQIMNNEKQAGRLPDLTGVKVYVIGAGSGTYRHNSSDLFVNVENFWMAYFKNAGAALPKERYGAALLSFDE